MKAEELAAIKARADAATPPPWGVYHNLNGWHYTKPGPEGTEPVLTSYDQTKADVEFIATARDGVPDLVQCVERLEYENARLREAIREAISTLNEVTDDAGAATAREVLVGVLEYTDS